MKNYLRLTVLTSCVSVIPIHAAVVFADGFESPVVSGFDPSQFSPGWSLNEPSSTDQLALRPLLPHTGSQVAQINANGSPPGASFSRMIPTIPGDDYTISLWFNSYYGSDAAVQVDFGSTSSTSTAVAAANTWYELTFVHKATTGSTMFTITDVTTNGATSDLLIDDITITSVPEPSAVAYLALGVAGAEILFRRRKA